MRIALLLLAAVLLAVSFTWPVRVSVHAPYRREPGARIADKGMKLKILSVDVSSLSTSTFQNDLYCGKYFLVNTQPPADAIAYAYIGESLRSEATFTSDIQVFISDKVAVPEVHHFGSGMAILIVMNREDYEASPCLPEGGLDQ